MAGEISFDYYYGDESSQFSFYRIPRQLITGDRFKRLSTDAKLLYGLTAFCVMRRYFHYFLTTILLSPHCLACRAIIHYG